MNKYFCIDCGKEIQKKKKKEPIRCQSCYLKFHRNSSPLECIDCGKPLNPKSARITKRCRFCFIKSHSTKFKESDYDDNFGHWLAGFTDGEGNFHGTNNHGQAFRINLREDDKLILEEIKNRLGCGVIHFLKKTKYNPKQRNQYQYTVATLVDLINIIMPFFDKYQLRAKKKQDYLIWRSKLLEKWRYASGG